MNALRECEMTLSLGETKCYISSDKDFIDFTTFMLGCNMVRITHIMKGSKQQILISLVKRINGGKVTKSMSCHQSLYSYLLYYCHFVLKVRVYKGSILDPTTKEKTNHGIAICHVDTSQWSPSHRAFVTLGLSSGLGYIEVGHWIFKNNLTYTTTTD